MKEDLKQELVEIKVKQHVFYYYYKYDVFAVTREATVKGKH